MRYDREHRRRRSIRLRGYDYRQPGAYFITICTYDKSCVFGHIVEGQMQLNECGQVVQEQWISTAKVRPNVELGAFVIMPNHLHAILIVGPAVGATRRVAPTNGIVGPAVGATRRVAPTNPPHGPARGSLGAIIGQFKSMTTKRVNLRRGTPGSILWQRNYYEHVIRSEESLNAIREYICRNPLSWASDAENPARSDAVGDDLEEVLTRISSLDW